jgi:hypothetical protein
MHPEGGRIRPLDACAGHRLCRRPRRAPSGQKRATCIPDGSWPEAGDGSRTHANSLEGCCATTTPRPQGQDGRGRIRTSEGKCQQIYSLPPLATREPVRERKCLSRQEDSNPRPEVYKTPALPAELCRHVSSDRAAGLSNTVLDCRAQLYPENPTRQGTVRPAAGCRRCSAWTAAAQLPL